MTRDELLTKLATELSEWPHKSTQARDILPSGFYWRGEYVIYPTDHRDGFSFCRLEWMERREELACRDAWSEGEERIDRIAQSDASGDHYAQAPCGSDVTACLLNPCGLCPGYEYAEDSDGESALSQALSMPSKYHVRLKGAWCDVYDVLLAFGVTNPADQHAIKKMLMPGKRGHKDGIQDRREAIQSLHRAIELEGGQ